MDSEKTKIVVNVKFTFWIRVYLIKFIALFSEEKAQKMFMSFTENMEKYIKVKIR